MPPLRYGAGLQQPERGHGLALPLQGERLHRLNFNRLTGEPERHLGDHSQNNTDTTLRRSSDPVLSEAPQESQKRASARFSIPQAGQTITARA